MAEIETRDNEIYTEFILKRVLSPKNNDAQALEE